MGAILDLPEMRARVRLWKVAEYEKLGDDPAFRRTELIRGIIVNKMSKSPLHSSCSKRGYDFFFQRSGRKFVVRKEEPLRLKDSMPEPDISVALGTEEEFDLRHPSTAELVVEVAVSSVAPDRENADLYAEAGVAEYWIILAEREAVEVYRRPLNGTYQERRTYGRGETIADVSVIGGAGMPVDAWFTRSVEQGPE